MWKRKNWLQWVSTAFAMKLKSLLFPLSIIEMFLQLRQSLPVLNSVDWTGFGSWASRGEGPLSGRWALCQSSREPSRRFHLCSSPSIRPVTARWKPLLCKRHMAARLEFTKRHLKDIQTIRNTILLITRPLPSPCKHGGGSIKLLGCFSVAGTGRPVRIEGQMKQWTDEAALLMSDWGGGSSLSRTTSWSTEPG